MKIVGDINISFANKRKAQKILKSIEVDNFDFIQVHIQKNTLQSHIESTSISSFIHTLDDYLACVSVAEKIVK